MITVCDIIEDLCCNRFFLKTRKFSNGYVKYSHFVCVCVCVANRLAARICGSSVCLGGACSGGLILLIVMSISKGIT